MIGAWGSEITTRANSLSVRSITTPGPCPRTEQKSFPKAPRHVPSMITPGMPVPGALTPRSSFHASVVARTLITFARGTEKGA